MAFFVWLVLLLGGAPVQESFDHYVANIVILQDKKLQKHLGITEAQRAKMNEYASKHGAALQKYGKEMEKAKKSVAAAGMDPKFEAIFKDLKDGVLKQLKPAQIKRLAEISIQVVGPAALSDDRVCTKIGVPKSTAASIRKVITDNMTKASKIQAAELQKVLAKYKDKDPKTDAEKAKLENQLRADMAAAEKRVAPQVEKIRVATETSILAKLTTAQKAAFKKLQGATYTP
ncbi:MAG: hypothetical protein HONBIEJF_00454 [Fimbriimonadaceae bacterium]|nr:hypothetical protein [Fimbriimonadaceae bacterium]